MSNFNTILVTRRETRNNTNLGALSSNHTAKNESVNLKMKKILPYLSKDGASSTQDDKGAFKKKYVLNKQKIVSNIRENFLRVQRKTNKEETDVSQRKEVKLTNSTMANNTTTMNTITSERSTKKRLFNITGQRRRKKSKTFKTVISEGFSCDFNSSSMLKDIRLHSANWSNNISRDFKSLSPKYKNNVVISTVESANYNFAVTNEYYSNPSKAKEDSHLRLPSPSPLTLNLPLFKKEKNQNVERNLFDKKKLKGKLINTLSKSLMMDNQSFEHYKLEKYYTDTVQNSHQEEYLNKYRRKLNIGIITHKTPDLFLPQPNYYTTRLDDFRVSPNELISKKNFTDKELEMLKLDPQYFQLQNSLFKDVDIFKNLSLLNTLRKEEHKSKKAGCKDSLRKPLTLSISKDKKKFKIINNLNKQANEDENAIALARGLENKIIKHFDPFPVKENINIDIDENQSNRKNDHETKMKLCETRKKLILKKNFERIKNKNKEQSDLIKLKKSALNKELFLTNEYVNKIKENYNKNAK